MHSKPPSLQVTPYVFGLGFGHVWNDQAKKSDGVRFVWICGRRPAKRPNQNPVAEAAIFFLFNLLILYGVYDTMYLTGNLNRHPISSNLLKRGSWVLFCIATLQKNNKKSTLYFVCQKSNHEFLAPVEVLKSQIITFKCLRLYLYLHLKKKDSKTHSWRV